MLKLNVLELRWDGVEEEIALFFSIFNVRSRIKRQQQSSELLEEAPVQTASESRVEKKKLLMQYMIISFQICHIQY